jgi:hypothetical protein
MTTTKEDPMTEFIDNPEPPELPDEDEAGGRVGNDDDDELPVPDEDYPIDDDPDVEPTAAP